MIVKSLAKRMMTNKINNVIVETERGLLDDVLGKVAHYRLDDLSKKFESKVLSLPEPPLGLPTPMSVISQIPFTRMISRPFNMFNLLCGFKDIEHLESFDTISNIYPNRRFSILETAPPSVPEPDEGFITTEMVYEKLDILPAHEKGITGKNIKVAVLDTGVNNTSPGFQGKVKSLSVPPHPRQVDINGHGTHCVSDVGANIHKNYRGIFCGGIAPEAELYAIKVLGFGVGTGSTIGIIKGIELAIEKGCKIISMSLGSKGVHESDSALCQVVNEATDKHRVLFAIANGNDGPDVGTVGCPACANKSIAVGSVRHDNERVAEFSSRGPTLDNYIKPDVSSLGGDSRTPKELMYNGTSGGSLLDGINDKITDSYAGLAGTSMATPKVAAILALWAQSYDLDYETVIDIFKENGHHQNSEDGYGLMKYSWIENY